MLTLVAHGKHGVCGSVHGTQLRGGKVSFTLAASLRWA